MRNNRVNQSLTPLNSMMWGWRIESLPTLGAEKCRRGRKWTRTRSLSLLRRSATSHPQARQKMSVYLGSLHVRRVSRDQRQALYRAGASFRRRPVRRISCRSRRLYLFAGASDFFVSSDAAPVAPVLEILLLGQDPSRRKPLPPSLELAWTVLSIPCRPLNMHWRGSGGRCRWVLPFHLPRQALQSPH
jgi:hypothetical protein